MRTRNAGMAALLLSAVWALPAAAEMPKSAVGSSHEMYTDDLSRALHDQRHMTRTSGITSEQMHWLQQAAKVHDTVIAMHMGTGTALAQLEGKSVTGSQGQDLGTIIAVDYDSQLAEVYMADAGMSVALPVRLLGAEGDHVTAPTVSKADAVAMVHTQAQVTQFASL